MLRVSFSDSVRPVGGDPTGDAVSSLAPVVAVGDSSHGSRRKEQQFPAGQLPQNVGDTAGAVSGGEGGITAEVVLVGSTSSSRGMMGNLPVYIVVEVARKYPCAYLVVSPQVKEVRIIGSGQGTGGKLKEHIYRK